MRWIRRSLASLFALPFALGSASAQVGTVRFASSGAPEAQADFLYGVAQLHNFEYSDAAAAFRRAQAVDPDFALAYWGEAMTYNHPIWMRQDREAARAALERLGATPAERIAKAPTPREKAYLHAVHVLYGDGDKRDRDRRYSETMARLRLDHPGDEEAAAFHALSILGTAHEGRDFATYMRAAAVAEEVFRDHPHHPGAAHYLIHSYDDPVHAPLGLRAARVYARIAPDAPHAQHMTSHIFVALGMWDEVVEANENASGTVNLRRQDGGQRPTFCGHYNSWLLYGYTQQGRVGEARALLRKCRDQVVAADTHASALDPDSAALASYLSMRARYLLDTERWSGPVSSWPVELSEAHVAERLTLAYVEGIAAVATGDLEAAARARERLGRARSQLAAYLEAQPRDLGPATSKRARILELQLDALVALARGDRQAAVERAREAVEMEEELPFFFGPPFIDKPSHEVLGEILLAAGQPEQALSSYEAALARTPRRTPVLAGLAQAAAAAGRTEQAATARRELERVRHRADGAAARE